MASLKQIEAAVKCTGLSSNLFLVEHEDAAEFEALRDDFFTEHAPSGPTETFLVEQMIAAAWRIRRIHVTEAAFWNLRMAWTDEDLDEKFEDPPKQQYLANALECRFSYNGTANNLARYESRLERAFYKALRELERLRLQRLPRQTGFVSPQPKIAPQTAPEPSPVRPRYTGSSCSESVLPPPLPVTCTSVAREPSSSTGSSPAETAER